MDSHKYKPALIIVGAYPDEKSTVFGGVIYNCMLLRQSKLYSQFTVYEFDITQKSIPLPHILLRLIFSVLRTIRFTALLLTLSLTNRKPVLVFLFAALSISFLEKSIFSLVCRLFRIKSAIYPLGCQLVNDCLNSYSLRQLISFSMLAPNFLFSQGSTWSNFFKNTCSIPAKKIHLLPSWTSTPSLLSHSQPTNARVSADIEMPNYVFTGWLVVEKGLLVLLEAFKQLIDLGYYSRLSLIGSGPLTSQISSLIYESDLVHYVTMLGQLSHPDTINYLASHADVFVLPSFNEGIPNSLIEATSLGIPSVVTNVGCISDYYPAASVCFVEPGSVPSLLEALISCHDSTKRASLSRQATLCSSTHFSTDAVVENLMSFIFSL